MSKRNMAVMKFSALGDIAACLQFMRSLDPNTYIITSPLGRSFLEDEFSNFLVLEDKSIKSHIKLIREIRYHGFDDIIDLQGNDRCRLLSKLCTIASHTITHNGYDPDSKYRPFSSLVSEISNKANAKRLYKPKPKEFIILNTGSSTKWSAKRPPTWKWKEFATTLNQRFNLPFKLTGSVDEINYVMSIAAELPFETEVVAGKTSLIELKVICRNAFLTVSTDSAAMHISAAEGTPTIGIFGSTTQKSIPSSPWATAVWDNSYYPDGNLPKCTSDIGNYYDNITLEDGLKKLEPFLQI
jgi:ADP-heptose:LPS heptosyltransferase